MTHCANTKVQEIEKLEKRTHERIILLEILTNEGNFKHNVAVLEKNEGVLVVARRNASKTTDVNDYIPCEYCKTFFLKKLLWHHVMSSNIRQYLNRNQDVEDLYDTDEEEDVIENIPIKDGGNYIRKGKLLLYSSMAITKHSAEMQVLLVRMQDSNEKPPVSKDTVIKKITELKH